MSVSISPAALNDVALCRGELLGVEVTHLNLEPLKTTGIGAEFFTAHLRYAVADARLPERMVVKMPLTGDRGRSEADAYEQLLSGGDNLATLRCFGVVDSDPQQPLALFFEDLRPTHWQTRWPIIPPLAQCEQAARALARVHAHWWGSDVLSQLTRAPVVAHQNAAHLQGFFTGFVDLVGDHLTASHLATFDAVFAGVDSLVRAHVERAGSTLLHNDAHFWNFLYPQDPANDECVIFDWPMWRTGPGGCDLAYMIALHLSAEHRERFQPALLGAYREELASNGVDRSPDEVLLDYRVGLVFQLLMPVLEFSWNNPPMTWLPKLEKALAAYSDLDCAALLKRI